VVHIDSKRLLLNDDVYLSDKLAQLEEKLGFYKLSRHWATISVVFSSKASQKPAELDYAERLESANNIISYLLKEVKVRETLKFLHGRYTT
jgi:aspartate kinase